MFSPFLSFPCVLLPEIWAMLCLLDVWVPFILTLSPGHQHEGPISTHHLRVSLLRLWASGRAPGRQLDDCDPVTSTGLGFFFLCFSKLWRDLGCPIKGVFPFGPKRLHACLLVKSWWRCWVPTSSPSCHSPAPIPEVCDVLVEPSHTYYGKDSPWRHMSWCKPGTCSCLCILT